jgi:hypothetical protein
MTTRDQVESFLNDLKFKMSIYQVVYLVREKNAQALLDLDITPAKRTEVLNKLNVSDYSEGPLDEKMRGMLPMWVFGATVNKREVYLKI